MRGQVWLGILGVVAACSFHGKGQPGAIDASGDGPPIDGPIDGPDPISIDATPAPSTCFGLWCKRKPITIDATRVTGGPHASFPVLIDLASDAELAAEARGDGFDIVFTAADGMTKLAHERMQFDKPTGRLVAWVAVASLSSTTDTLIYMHWGHPLATDQQNVAATWDATTEAVWHLDNLGDSTDNDNDGTPIGGVGLGAIGIVGGAASFDGMNDVIRVAESSSLDSTTSAATLAAWVKLTDAIDGGFQSILTSGNTYTGAGDGYSWAIQPDGDLYCYPWAGDVNNFNVGVPAFTNGTWHHVVVTFLAASRELEIYVDGVAMAFTAENVPALWTTLAQPTFWNWGGNPDRTGEFFRGSLDELRVSRVVRSAGWIATEFRNQKLPRTFSIIGPAEILTP